jgi:hypothetical protein
MGERAMGTGGRREEIDATIARWEGDLERLRLALANAPEATHAQHHPTFVELYRRKEIVKSRWEAIRGVYQREVEAVRHFEDALAGMEAAWPKAEAMLAEVLPARAA